MVFALQVSRAPNAAGGTLSAGNPAIGANQPSSLRYMHHDHLGSVAVVTNEAGAVLERLAFDPWGKRRNINGKADTTDALVGLTTDRGYTEHEHLDEMGVIHMNGRIYDPLVGRMMSADPFIQAPGNLQSYNRYSYVWNNPLNSTDPTGYFNIFDPLNLAPTARAVHTAVTNPNSTNIFNAHRSVPGVVALDNFVVRNPWAFQLGRIAAGVWGGPWAAAGATGYYTYLTTGCESCSVKAFGLSLGTAYAFQAAGDVGQGANEYGAGHYAAHAAVGCASSVAGGGQCGAGALSAVAGLAGTQIGAGIEITGGRFATAVIAGGVASRLAGGSFIDGAQTAAYGYLFNHLSHWAELAAYGREAHTLLQNEMEQNGYTVESKCAGVYCVNGRFDIADATTAEVWEIKRNSIFGHLMGQLSLDAYTDNTGLSRGGNLVGMRVGRSMTLMTNQATYTYTNYGGGLIGYTRESIAVPSNVTVPKPFPLPGRGGRRLPD
jgi:RHS repeat-associated protein